MSKASIIVDTAVAVANKISKSDDIKSFLCGTYSDGTPRSLPDAITNELYSPEQKSKAEKLAKKKKKNKKNKKKLTKLKL